MINKLKNRLRLNYAKWECFAKNHPQSQNVFEFLKPFNPDGSEVRHGILTEQPLVEGKHI
jgi:hypothetical protein